MLQSGTNRHTVDFSSLKPATRYDVFVAGREDFGTVIAPTHFQFETPGAQGTLTCPLGWALANAALGRAECGQHGECLQGKCVCHQGYGGTACERVVEEAVDAADPTRSLIHLTLALSGSFDRAADCEQFLQTALHQGGACPLR